MKTWVNHDNFLVRILHCLYITLMVKTKVFTMAFKVLQDFWLISSFLWYDFYHFPCGDLPHLLLKFCVFLKHVCMLIEWVGGRICWAEYSIIPGNEKGEGLTFYRGMSWGCDERKCYWFRQFCWWEVWITSLEFLASQWSMGIYSSSKGEMVGRERVGDLNQEWR